MRATYLRGSPAERFWPKVDRDGPVPEHRPDIGSCWLWTAALRADGYGVFNAGGRLERAHRWAWQDEHGPVPDGLELDHLCRRKDCVRPSHLEAVTHKVNSERGLPGGRSWRAELTHCKRGHEFTPENTRDRGNGHRGCRACNIEQGRERRRRAKEAR